MVNYWYLGIGINQYRFLPSLSYAQRDAELLHEFLVQAGGFSPRHCHLLTDHITVVSSDSRFPTAEHIQTRLAQLQDNLKPEDLLLCFFSGYGLQVQGQDFLLPIEADPKQVATTAIAIETWFQALKALPANNILLLIDANRSQLGPERGGFGQQTAQLAQTYGIATLLSCQPDQFSHEPLTLRQGIFTAALISAWQNGCVTVEQLVDVLHQQMPRLSEELWRPRQDVLAVVPAHLRYQLVLPDLAIRDANAAHWSSIPTSETGYGAGSRPIDPLAKPILALSRRGNQFIQTMNGWLNPGKLPSAPDFTANPMVAANPALELSEPDPLALSDEFFWRRLLVQGGLIAGILLFGVILRNSSALINAGNHTSQRAIAPPTQPPAPSPVANSPAANPVPTPSASNLPLVALDPVLVLQSAQSAFEAKQYEDANRQLAQLPVDQRTPEHNQLLEQTNRELLNQGKTMLIRTRKPVPENQVSDLVEAIKMARLIKPDQPLYQEAQQAIDRWSRVILDMAQGRAARSNEASVIDAANNYSMAISAARLVPLDQAKVYEQAQQAIALWSQMILDLANTRAANGELDLAIQIGELVPPNTPTYAPAQEAIANWRNQPAPVVEAPNGDIDSGAPLVEEDEY